MSSSYYLTLSEAEQLTGIKADTLKKRCQEGKIKGAMKKGEVWQIPRDQIISEPGLDNKDFHLVVLASYANYHLFTLSITLYVNGNVISGTTISAREFIELNQAAIKGISNIEPITIEMLDKAYNDIFLSQLPKKPNNADETKKILEDLNLEAKFIHLKDVKTLKNGIFQSLNDIPMRVNLSSVDAFHLGVVDSN
jgi:hypothetical protein